MEKRVEIRIEERRFYTPEDLIGAIGQPWGLYVSGPSGRKYYWAILTDEHGRQASGWGWSPEEAIQSAKARLDQLPLSEEMG